MSVLIKRLKKIAAARRPKSFTGFSSYQIYFAIFPAGEEEIALDAFCWDKKASCQSNSTQELCAEGVPS